jgi:hypothetical protein
MLWSAACSREQKPVPLPPSGLSDKDAAALAEEASESAVEPDSDGFRRLRLRDFEMFAAQPDTWSEADGVITTTGKPKGYIHSKRGYKNLTWQAEFRFLPPDDPSKADQANTGFMLCIQEPHKVWPRSVEVQGKFVEMGQIKSNGGVPALSIKDDPEARESARKPVGEWNAIEIVVKDGAVSATLNGKLICTSEPGEVRDGKIGLQAENFGVEFRNVRIREE